MRRTLKDLINENFSDIIDLFEFNLIDKTQNWGHIELANKNCIIRFIDDCGYIEASFVNPLELKESEDLNKSNVVPHGFQIYPVFSVYDFLFPYDKVNYRQDLKDPDHQVKAIKNILIDRLSNILKSDFSWVDAFKNL